MPLGRTDEKYSINRYYTGVQKYGKILILCDGITEMKNSLDFFWEKFSSPLAWIIFLFTFATANTKVP
jgi:hypothetical protein